jgi:uncharacterized protein
MIGVVLSLALIAQDAPKLSLSDAVLYGDAKTVQSLIASGAAVDEMDATGMTPLMVAASEGRTTIATLLIAAGANVKLAGEDGTTALMRAASADRIEVMKLLLTGGADVNAKNKGGMTALMVAAFGGYPEAVRLLVASKADPNAKDNQGRTALMAAATSGHASVVDALFSAGADPNVSDAGHGTPMTYAAAEGHAEAMAALQTRGLKPNAGDLALAAAGCHTDAVRLALASGVSANGAEGDVVPLLSAAGANCVDVVRLLLERGAHVNAKDHDGWTALIKASQSGRADMVQLLMDRGADMNIADDTGRTAWMFAAMGGHTDIADIFKRARAARGASHRLDISSPALTNDQPMPRQYTPDGRNDSPPLSWANVPDGTKSFAVVCEDPDAGNPPPFVHWVIYNIPPDSKGLPEAIPFEPGQLMPNAIAGATQGLSGFRRPFYRGPAPPPGKPHHYHFVVYALDLAPELTPGLTRADLLDAINGHIVGQGELVATYERK